MGKQPKKLIMPWSIIALPALICIIWGFNNGRKVKLK